MTDTETDTETDAAILMALPEARRKYPTFFSTQERAWGAAAALAVFAQWGRKVPPETRTRYLARASHLMVSGELDLASGRYTSKSSNEG